jgi:hypothetical protein
MDLFNGLTNEDKQEFINLTYHVPYKAFKKSLELQRDRYRKSAELHSKNGHRDKACDDLIRSKTIDDILDFNKHLNISSLEE